MRLKDSRFGGARDELAGTSRGADSGLTDYGLDSFAGTRQRAPGRPPRGRRGASRGFPPRLWRRRACGDSRAAAARALVGGPRSRPAFGFRALPKATARGRSRRIACRPVGGSCRGIARRAQAGPSPISVAKGHRSGCRDGGPVPTSGIRLVSASADNERLRVQDVHSSRFREAANEVAYVWAATDRASAVADEFGRNVNAQA